MRKSAPRLARKRRQSFIDDDEPLWDEREPFDVGGPAAEKQDGK